MGSLDSARMVGTFRKRELRGGFMGRGGLVE